MLLENRLRTFIRSLHGCWLPQFKPGKGRCHFRRAKKELERGNEEMKEEARRREGRETRETRDERKHGPFFISLLQEWKESRILVPSNATQGKSLLFVSFLYSGNCKTTCSSD
jgi:hypothetical protein